MALTTAAKVRIRLNIDTYQAPDATIAQFIAAADGVILHNLGRTPTATDEDYELAVSVSTDMAAFRTGTQIPYPEDKDEAAAWQKRLDAIESIAAEDLERLTGTQAPIPVAKSTTVD